MVKVTVNDPLGLHARPAGIIVKEVMSYPGDVVFIKDDKEFNAKSIMKIMSMGVKHKDEFYIKATGEQSEEFEKKLKELVEGFE